MCVHGCALPKINQSITVIDINIHPFSKVFESNRVIVTLEWTQASSFHFYNVSVIPSQSVEVMSRGSTRVQLALSYNTQYNVSVVATHICGQTYRVTNLTELYYSKLNGLVNDVNYIHAAYFSQLS